MWTYQKNMAIGNLMYCIDLLKKADAKKDNFTGKNWTELSEMMNKLTRFIENHIPIEED